ncbi:2-hydroxyacyl-CoA dehydratase [Pelomyxa schiedti]|nr:2-hydroxyacyl-CoA dehydratase [Pelomyxa schiedti]
MTTATTSTYASTTSYRSTTPPPPVFIPPAGPTTPVLHIGVDIGSTTVKVVALRCPTATHLDAGNSCQCNCGTKTKSPSATPCPPAAGVGGSSSPPIIESAAASGCGSGAGAGSTASAVESGMMGEIEYCEYTKHFSDIKASVTAMLSAACTTLLGHACTMCVTGSGGLNVAQSLGVPFVQEVIACTEAIEIIAPGTDVAIELGGEDAKITYFGKAMEQRMNGTCAGGTGSFIDHMAALLMTDSAGLNELAKNHHMVYPIASRCGVFAKTDIQPLLNEGAKKEDIAISVFQAVVNQTISGLACGKPIRGKVAFLGGPLHFLSELRGRFIHTLQMKPEDVVFPDNAHYFVALGAALYGRKDPLCDVKTILASVPKILNMPREESRLPPMFASDAEYRAFKDRHSLHKVPRAEKATFNGQGFLGIDSGSTTTKIVLIDESGRLVYSYYDTNQGSPLLTTIGALKAMHDELPGVKILCSAVTGYGEGLIKAALHIDHGEIETISHYKAADFFLPGVDFVLDIGGQDMKSLSIRHGAIDSISLNEACSSGCGSFISTFAHSLNMTIQEFAEAGIYSKDPVDLGTRCTVFMNSRVKQSQKEGASVEDISGGIAMSVVKNALFKVIRMKSPAEMGDKIVVQGGTFLNDSVLRSFEKICGKDVVRPDIAGLMGAFGAALIARERYVEGRPSSTLSRSDLDSLSAVSTTKRCGRCVNNCLLTINTFSDGGSYISGNRCERGALLGCELTASKRDIPNMYEWKYRRVFQYPPRRPDDAPRGDIGIPRVLNIYEDYPFWFTLFNTLGFRVLLSNPSNKRVYELGMETIPSDTVCYPAKLVHGHIQGLIDRGIKRIWYPCVVFNTKEDSFAGNNYNCPVVGSYPEVIKHNLTVPSDVRLLLPFLPIDDPGRMAKRLKEEFRAMFPDINDKEIQQAVTSAYAELERYRSDLRKAGETAIETMRSQKLNGIVILGRPYHIDPEINHGIPDIIIANGFAVLSEDSIAHLGRQIAHDNRPLRVVDQWVYHSRMYSAARFIVEQPDLDMLQLVSFGCGLDAVTTDQVKETMERFGKIYTAVKIDEINNLGAARIRIRSLVAIIRQRLSGTSANMKPKQLTPFPGPVFFTKAMQNTHTIIAPQFSPFHMDLMVECFKLRGFKQGHYLPVLDKACVDEGLKYVHNDSCFPAVCVIGQIMHALNSGKYDLHKVAVALVQTGGCCRATNYVAFLKKALRDAGMPQIPVLSINAYGMEDHPGFQLDLWLGLRALMGLIYGDLFMNLVQRCRPYEVVKGSARALQKECEELALKQLVRCNRRGFRKTISEIVRRFEQLPLVDEKASRPRVGIVGEIMVKLADDANNHLVDFLEAEGAESITHDLSDFFLYCVYDHVTRYSQLSGSLKMKFAAHVLVAIVEHLRAYVDEAMRGSKRFHAPEHIEDLADLAEQHGVSLCNQAGEGWFLTAEMLSMLRRGITNIVCLQPFACLPNHVTGRGMMRLIRNKFPTANIAAIDYDPGASEINQINRVKLMLAIAKKNMAQETVQPPLSMSPDLEDLDLTSVPTGCMLKSRSSHGTPPTTVRAAAAEICASCSESCAARDKNIGCSSHFSGGTTACAPSPIPYHVPTEYLAKHFEAHGPTRRGYRGLYWVAIGALFSFLFDMFWLLEVFQRTGTYQARILAGKREPERNIIRAVAVALLVLLIAWFWL